ncbi:MAG: DEAD/DEAH box helicase, partial [Pseudomonadota bacterium]
ILITDRCHFDSVHGSLLRQGAEIAARLNWISDKGASGRQRLSIVPKQDAVEDKTDDFDAVLPTAPPCYIKTEHGVLGTLDLGLPLALAARLAEAPEVSLSEAAQLSILLDRRFAKSGIKEDVPLPEAPQKTKKREVEPIPRLELYQGQVRFKEPYSWYVKDAEWRGDFNFPLARLSFDYDGEIIQCEAKSEFLERLEGDILILTPRDTTAELNALKQLSKLGLEPMEDCPLIAVGEKDTPLYFVFDDESTGSFDQFFEAFRDPNQFISFSSHAVPKLIADGWQITYSDDYPYQIAEGETDWWADVEEGSGIDWFSFELGVEFEGERISLAPHLASLLAQLPTEFKDLMRSDAPKDIAKLHELGNSLNVHHKLSDGRLLPLPANRLMPMLKALLELIGPRFDKLEAGKVQLHRAEAGALVEAADLLGQNLELTANAERLIKLGKDLRRGHSLQEITPPASFGAELRPYQLIGLSWLDFLRETGLGGVLADDMGLGKTVQTLAFLLREKLEGRLDKPALIVAPTSVLPNWQAEAQRFAPDLKVLMLRGPDRKQLFGEITSHDLILTTYPLLPRDAGVLLEHEYHAAILDEAQAIKNPKAALAKHAHAIKADHRFALTGTPLENNLGEVWSLFQFLSPGLLGDATTFRRTFRTPIEKHGCQVAQSFLTRRLKPFMLRRTKQEVAKELPPKTEIIEHVRLEGAQRDLYETVRVLMHDKVRDQIAKKGLAKSHIVFLDALLKLRQICCDPRLLKMSQARKVKQSAKLERLMQMLPEMVAEGRRILLFSQFTKMLALIEAELTALNIPYVILTGDTQDRAKPVQTFQSGKVPIFLLSLKAGGTGLNLTAADTVIHYDPWWNPAVEAQATDRAYRIGQTKNVFVYKFMVEEGIEEAIELLKARKAALADALFAGASKSGLDLTEADISALFAPLQSETLRKIA